MGSGRMRHMVAILLAVVGGVAAAQDRVTLNFANTEIEAVARAVGQFTGKTFIVDPRVKGTLNLTIEQPMSPEQAMAALSAALRLQGVALVESGGVVRVVPEAEARLQGGPVQSGALPGRERGDQLVTQVFRLNYESATSLVPVLRPLISQHLCGVPEECRGVAARAHAAGHREPRSSGGDEPAARAHVDQRYAVRAAGVDHYYHHQRVAAGRHFARAAERARGRVRAAERRADPGRHRHQYADRHRAGGRLSPAARRDRQARRAPRSWR